MGAAAFIIAEFLKISYLDVLLMAVIPTCLFYLALFLMVEIDVRKYGMSNTIIKKVDTVWNLTRHYWFHFLSLRSEEHTSELQSLMRISHAALCLTKINTRKSYIY